MIILVLVLLVLVAVWLVFILCNFYVSIPVKHTFSLTKTDFFFLSRVLRLKIETEGKEKLNKQTKKKVTTETSEIRLSN